MGEALGFVSLWRVLITYIARAEAAQRQMQGEIGQLEVEQAAEAAKSQTVANLAGGIAHEFNNLLAVVIGNLDLIEMHLPEGSEVREQLEEALAASLRSADLTQHLLAFGRNQPLFEVQTDLNAVVASMNDERGRSFPPEASLQLELSPDMLLVNIDPAQFNKALKNLVANAVEAMPSGGRILIRTEATHGLSPGKGASQGRVRVSISDTGCGIPDDQLGRVFEPFFTTKTESTHSGLGLSMVYGFVKQSGGDIEVVSKEGHGTTVHVSFPSSIEARAPLFPRDQPTTSHRSTILILVVDDDAAVRATVAAQLASLGYQIVEALDGADALRQAASDPNIALVITDLLMPGMNGLELGRELSIRTPKLRVLYTSGFSREGTAGEIVPPECFLAKPYRKHDLAQKVEQLLAAG
ncbi:MAG: ATP-binding protein [Pseudomonadota bacterium]|nr:ATP-binding protein [Pseudomonadota bacterium]